MAKSSAARKQREKLPALAKMTLTLHVNGVAKKLNLAPWTTLLDALRIHIGLTGKKRVATTANAAPARSWSMVAGSIPA
jgi:hypothetical protein